MEIYYLIVQQFDNQMNIKKQVMYLDAPPPIMSKLESGQLDNEVKNYFINLDNIVGADEVEELIRQLEENVERTHFRIYSHDTVSSICEKLSNDFNVPFFKQYLSKNMKTPLSHTLRNDRDEKYVVDYNMEGQDLYGANIDRNLYILRDEYSQYGREYSLLASKFLTRGLNILKLIDIEDIIKLGRYTDTEIELMYYGFVWKFWPMDIDLFRQYLDGGDKASFPDLFMYRKSFPLDDLITQSKIKKLADTVENINYIEYVVYSLVDIDAKYMFQVIHCSHEIPIMNVIMRKRKNIIYLTKVHTELEYNKLYTDNKQHLYLRKNELSMLYMKGNMSYAIKFTPRYYSMKFFPHSDDVDFDKAFDIASSDVNHLINRINGYGSMIFHSNRRYSLSNRNNMIVNDLSLRIIFGINIPINRMNQFIDNMRHSGLFTLEPEGSKASGLFLYEYGPDIMSYMQKNDNNYYAYESNHNARALFDTYYKRSYEFIMRFDKNIIVTIDNIDLHLSGLLIRVISYIAFNSDLKSSSEVVSYTSLRFADPVLFDLGKYAIKRNYCRLCQKKKQPIAISESDYDKLPANEQSKYTRYWNFTNNAYIYYKCPNKDVPYLGFIVDKHPQDYCLPCCGKRPLVKGTKKYIIYNTCMEQYKYKSKQASESSFTRYIMNYNREKFEAGRLYKLPNALDEYLYTIMRDPNIIKRKISIEGAKYNLKTIKDLLDLTKTYMKPTNSFADYLKDYIPNKNVSYEQLLENPSLSKKNYEKIMHPDENDYIIIYNQKLVHGHHVLANAVLNNNPKVPVKKLSHKMLKKSSKLDKNVYYYIMITPSSFSGIEVSALYAISVISDVATDALITHILSGNINDVVKYDIMGAYGHSYKTYEEVISAFSYELDNSMLTDNDWNHLVIYSCAAMLDVNIVTYEVRGSEFYIHTYGKATLTKPLLCMLKDGNYYPILYTSSKNFLNNIIKKFYNAEDTIYQMTMKIMNKIRKQETASYYNLFGSSIKHVYIVNNVVVHSLAIEYEGTVYTIPCQYHNYTTEHDRIYDYPKYSDIKYSADELSGFVAYYNKTVLNVLPPLKVDGYIIYAGNAIGFVCEDLYYYFAATSLYEVRGLKAYEHGNPKIINIMYEPDELNATLVSYKLAATDAVKYKEAMYKKNILMLASIELFENIDKEAVLNSKDPKNMLMDKIREIFIIDKPEYKGSHLITRCNLFAFNIDKSIYCRDDKYVLDPDMVGELITTLLSDLKNPIKRNILEGDGVIFNILSDETFQMDKHERLYINIY